MATQATSSSPSSTPSSSSCPQWKYDVFLSFCGVDTRKNFTDHLYATLKQKNIITFRDDEKLERGKYISSELLKAIEESKYAIVVLSTNYAFSKWCLIELAKIVECKEKTKLTVLPIFYHVDPSDVRNQRDDIAKAFAEHENDTKVHTEDVQTWKAALKDVGCISGWHVHDRHESIVIQQILERISSELNLVFQSTISNELVGIESRVREMLDLYLDEGSDGVRFVGICGMGGIGKTTLALSIYERISSNFEASSFIADVREKNKNQQLVSLQEQLLSDILMAREINLGNVHEGIKIIGNRLRGKKVLIVLDDVDGEKQLKALVGNHNWFGPASRIIITSRNDHLLRRCGVDYIYNAKELNDKEALRLFSLSAFKNLHPKENYVDLSMYFVNYTKGLPLALQTLGSLLFNKSIDEWKSAIDVLKAEPSKEILDVLQISFDGLTNMQKELFLDIACFFKQKNKDCIRDILKSFGYNPDYNIGVLMDMSLITINKNGDLCMHDLLQEMGQQIVFRESPNKPGGRRRLWHYEDVLHTLKNNTGTDAVEGIKLNTPNQKEESLSAEAFTKMTKLRFLNICNVQLPKGLNYLSNELRFIEWYKYPLKSMPTGFQPNRLVELRMRCSRIKHLWKGIMGDEPIHYFTIPGREIPKWFRHQSVGTSVNLQVPSSDKLKGVAVCAVFVLRQHHPLHQLHSDYVRGYRRTHTLECCLKANEYESYITGFCFSEQFGKIESYHLCLSYYPHKFFNQNLKQNWSQIDANGLGQTEIIFKTKGPGLEVTKCGARWVYEQDIEDLNQTMSGCSSGSSCSITPYEDDLEDSAKDTKTE